MKKIIFSCILFLSVLETFGQQKTIPATLADGYLKKSRNQKTTAWVLLGGGTALYITGFALLGSQDKSGFNDITSGEIIGGIGVVSALASIPFFISSGHNKRKAVSASANVGMQKVYILKDGNIAFHSSPGLSILLSFKKTKCVLWPMSF